MPPLAVRSCDDGLRLSRLRSGFYFRYHSNPSVEIPMKLKHVCLFSGIGGFLLAAKRAGFESIQAVEIEPFCQSVLRKNFPDLSIHDDIRTYNATYLRGTIGLVTGGFPCQDISIAGKGAGIAGGRSGLWCEMFRIICECRPAFVLIENVPALRNRGADRVLSDLEGAGYTAGAFVVGADDIGATHRRKRVWIVGYDRERCLADARHRTGRNIGEVEAGHDTSGERSRNHSETCRSGGDVAYAATGQGNERRPGDVDTSPGGGESGNASTCDERDTLAHSDRSGREEPCGAVSGGEELPSSEHGGETMAYDDGRRELQSQGSQPEHRRRDSDGIYPFRFPPARNDFRGWATVAGVDASLMPCVEREVCRVADGIPSKLVRRRRSARNATLKALGNAIVPEVAELFCHWIYQQLKHV